jgi:hypothetical protein
MRVGYASEARMKTCCKHRWRLLWAIGVVLSAAPVEAAVMFLGPTPYMSRANSPFPVSGNGSDFFLEDFEDGELNTPGILQPLHYLFGTAFHGVVLEPSEFTDSTDGDDGDIDGFGTAGHSFRSRALFTNQTIPQRNTVDIKFEFDPTELGYLPNAFGFSWTDGPVGIDNFRPGLDLRIVVTDSAGNEFLSPYVKLFANVDRNGQTAEDLFFGVIADAPISEVTIFGVYYGESETMPHLEIDHVQYGRLVIPEPRAYSFIALVAATLAIRSIASSFVQPGVV